MPEAFIVDAVRTPVGKRGGALAGVHSADLAGITLAALMRRTGVDPGAVDDFKHFCKTTGAKLIEQREEPDGVLVFLLEKPA